MGYECGGVMQIMVQKALTGDTITLNVSASCTIEDLKEHYRERENIPIDMMDLLYSGAILDNWKTFGQCAIGEGSRLQVIIVSDPEDTDEQWFDPLWDSMWSHSLLR